MQSKSNRHIFHSTFMFLQFFILEQSITETFVGFGFMVGPTLGGFLYSIQLGPNFTWVQYFQFFISIVYASTSLDISRFSFGGILFSVFNNSTDNVLLMLSISIETLNQNLVTHLTQIFRSIMADFLQCPSKRKYVGNF